MAFTIFIIFLSWSVFFGVSSIPLFASYYCEVDRNIAYYITLRYKEASTASSVPSSLIPLGLTTTIPPHNRIFFAFPKEIPLDMSTNILSSIWLEAYFQFQQLWYCVCWVVLSPYISCSFFGGSPKGANAPCETQGYTYIVVHIYPSIHVQCTLYLRSGTQSRAFLYGFKKKKKLQNTFWLWVGK